MTKLNWDMASHRSPDAARVQQINDFVEPDAVIVKRKSASTLNVWGQAIQARFERKPHKQKASLTRQQLLTALGITKKEMRSKRRGLILKRLVSEGMLQSDGNPNVENHKVIEIMNRREGKLNQT